MLFLYELLFTAIEPAVNLNGSHLSDRSPSSLKITQVSPPPPAISVVTFRWDDDVNNMRKKGEPDRQREYHIITFLKNSTSLYFNYYPVFQRNKFKQNRQFSYTFYIYFLLDRDFIFSYFVFCYVFNYDFFLIFCYFFFFWYLICL